MSKKIVIGAGHYFNTAGKRTPDGVREWTMNDGVVRKFYELLKDYDVVIVREDDPTGKTNTELDTRNAIVKKENPNLYISIHHNANTGQWGAWSGFSVHYMYTWKDLASRCLSSMAKFQKIKSRGVVDSDFQVLRCIPKTIPALLTEGGFMDSTVDSQYIRSEEGMMDYAEGLADFAISELKLVKKVVQPTTSVPEYEKWIKLNSTSADAALKYIQNEIAEGKKTGGYGQHLGLLMDKMLKK